MNNPLGEATPQPTASPLDNPLGVPPQAPLIDQPQPTTTQPSWTNIPSGDTDNQPNTTSNPSIPTEAAPTDLSHLITGNQPEQANPVSPETLVVPPATTAAPEVSNPPAQTHKGIPRWLIGVGIGLLVLVIAASAYFILGIGQPAKTTSLPVETTPKTAAVQTPAPIITPTNAPVAQPAASGSANFGQLGGAGGGQSPTPSLPSSASSAAQILLQQQKQRQQQGI